MKKSKSLTIRYTEKEDAKIRKGAEKSGMTASEYVRRASLNSRTRVRKIPEEKVRMITQTQASLNDLMIMEENGSESSESKKLKIKEIQEGLNNIWTLLS